MNTSLHIPVSNFNFIEDNDDHFLKVRLQAIASGENLNRSDFDKDGMEESMDTFRGKPLLCAFPKNKYTDEYRIGDGHNSSDIKYDSEYNEFYHSYLDPDSERMVGYIPFDSNITCELIDGKYWICMDAVILRKYNHELVVDILNKKKGKSKRDNKRISVEIEVIESHFRQHDTQNYEIEVIDKFKGMGVTILFDDTQEAVVGANLKAFSESIQYNNFKSFMKNFSDENFIDKNDIGTGKRISIKRNKFSNNAWGDVDKSELYKKTLKASNYKTLVKFIYAKVEQGWEENPSSKLKYPIGEIIGDEAVYNRYGLSNALSRSKSQNDEDVTRKVEMIMDRLDIDHKTEYAVEINDDTIDNKKVVDKKLPDILQMEEDIATENLVEKKGVDDLDKDKIMEENLDNEKDLEKQNLESEDDNDGLNKEEFDDSENQELTEEQLSEEQLSEEQLSEEQTHNEELSENVKPEESFEDDNKGKDDDGDEDDDKDEDDNKEDMSVSLESNLEKDECLVEKCKKCNCNFVCTAGDYVIYSHENKIYASNISADELNFATEVKLSLGFTVINVGGVNNDEQISVPINVSFEESAIEITNSNIMLESKCAELEDKNIKLQDDLNNYKKDELLNRFEDICFESNLSVSEKADWRDRISKFEFNCEDELIEKFGGYMFKKNFDNKENMYNTNVNEKTKVNKKKSYETLIDQYMNI